MAQRGISEEEVACALSAERLLKSILMILPILVNCFFIGVVVDHCM
jgi:hypothetical protein